MLGGFKRLAHWLTLEQAGAEPTWANVHYPPIDYQSIVYYSAPKTKKDGPKSLDEVDPELLRTYEKLGIPLLEREILSGVAVDAVFDSVSVATTFREKLESRNIFARFLRRCGNNPDLSKNSDRWFLHRQFLRGAHAAVLPMFVAHPARRALPMDSPLPHQRKKHRQFERTLIIARVARSFVRSAPSSFFSTRATSAVRLLATT